MSIFMFELLRNILRLMFFMGGPWPLVVLGPWCINKCYFCREKQSCPFKKCCPDKSTEIQNLAGSYSSARRSQLVISLLLFSGPSLSTCQYCSLRHPGAVMCCLVLSALPCFKQQLQCQLSSEGLSGSTSRRTETQPTHIQQTKC